MAGTLRRFFVTASTSGLFARILSNTQIMQNSQSLYDQILPSAPCISADESNAHSGDNEPDKIWALVAIVATVMTEEMKRQKKEEKTQAVGRKQPVEWNLVHLLAEAGVGLQEFLLYFTSLFNRLLLEPELLAATTLIKEDFTIATLLFEKYRLLWTTLIATNEAPAIGNQVSAVSSDPEPESPVAATQEPPNQVKMQQRRRRCRQLFEGGWVLFLLAKRRLRDEYSGLGQLYNLLLATLHFIGINAQRSQATVEAEVAAALSALGTLGTAKASPVKCGRGSGVQTSAQILKALCAAPKVDPAHVVRASEHLGLVLTQLKDDGAWQHETETTNHRVVASLTVFADVVLEANVTRLSERYEKDYLDGCGKLDERFYLNDAMRRTILGTRLAAQEADKKTRVLRTSSLTRASSDKRDTGRSNSHVMLSPVRRNMMARRRETDSTPSTRGLMTPPRHNQQSSRSPSPSMRSWQWQGSPRRQHFFPLGASPRPSPMRTPVTTAVETNQWVRDTLSSTSSTPVTPKLRQLFSECTVDPTERIARVLNDYGNLLIAARKVHRVAEDSNATASMVIDDTSNDTKNDKDSPSFSLGVDDSLKRAKTLSLVLFYRVLEPLLVSERQRLRNHDLSKLLNNEIFVAALFACSAEVVLKAYSLITISFPFLLDHLHVNAFHFVTTSESFVKYAPHLPSALKKHMGDVKDRILDSLVWRSDSALYQLLAGAQKSTTTTTSSPRLSSVSRLDRSNSAGISPTHAPVLRLFFRMVFSRAASRIHQLCRLVGLDSTDQNQIWTAMKECLTSHQHLLKDRHLDLLILCNIYAVCKVSRGPNVSHAAATMSFKHLLSCYKELNRQNHTSISSLVSSRHGEGITHGIILEHETSGTEKRGDIIKFYNRCYIASMKVFILQFQYQESQMAAADAVVAAHALEQPGFHGFSSLNGATCSSDAESIARAAAEAVQRLCPTNNNNNNSNSTVLERRNRLLVTTPPRPIRRDVMRSSPFVSSPAVAAFQLFTSTEVQMLPIAVNQTSPQRVKASNVFMSPLQQVRFDRRLTPRSHALYAIGESPARDLALINRAVNSAPANLRHVRAPSLFMESDPEQDNACSSPSASVSPVQKKQKTAS